MSLGSSTNQHRNPRIVNASTAPEDVFLAWLLSRPGDADLVSAAHREIVRLGAHVASHAGAKRLHDLFRTLIREEQALTAPSIARAAQ